jgi:hypothetical protein
VMKSRIGCWRSLVVLGALVAVGVASPVASGHDSDWCSHGTLSGKYWRLTYITYDNNTEVYTPNGYRQAHYHKAQHDFRDNPRGYFSFAHNYETLCGTEGDPAFAADPTTHLHLGSAEHLPEPPLRNTPTLQPTKLGQISCCLRSRDASVGTLARAAIAAIGGSHRIRLLRLEPRLQLDGRTLLVDVPVPQALATDCLLLVGTTSLRAIAGDLPRAVGVEIAEPSLAARVGHPCRS